jgi:hypothetical protein
MYHLVQFSESVVEIIHENWIESRKIHCDGEKETNLIKVAFPPKQNYNNIRKYLRDKVPSHSTWSTYDAEIIFSNGELSHYILTPTFVCHSCFA